jgi:hypothetical protein
MYISEVIIYKTVSGHVPKRKLNKCSVKELKIQWGHFRVWVLLIVEDCDCEMQNSNKSAVPLLEFMSKCNVE